MIYESVLEVEPRISVKGVLNQLQISTSGYYDWRKRKPSNQAIHQARMKEKILEIHQESFQIYGAPKITKLLQAQGHTVAQRTVTKYMAEEGIKAHYIAPYTNTTRDSDFSINLKNVLKRDFTPSRPNAAWCTDITYIWTQTGFVYLTSIMDLYSRKIVAWELLDRLSVDGILSCIKKAKRNRFLLSPIIIHSDRGVQFVSNAYKEALGNAFTRSYSRKANPWDNACIESFHALIKREWLNKRYFKNLASARKAVFEYIEIFYNPKRIHSTIDYLSPMQYETRYKSVS